jgi:hypothetical protein
MPVVSLIAYGFSEWVRQVRRPFYLSGAAALCVWFGAVCDGMRCMYVVVCSGACC